MNKTFVILIMVEILSSCSNGLEQGSKADRELLPYPEKHEHDGYSELPDSLKPKFIPDTTIGQISLINSHNVDKYLGKNIMDKLDIDAEEPQIIILSKDKKQKLTIYFHSGGMQKEFAEFKIEFNDNSSTDNVIVNDNEFSTENKIKLNMTVGDIKSIKGEPKTIKTTEEQTVYHYHLDDFTHSNFLKKYNMPIYYADYSFSNGYLTEFKFGFEYP